MIQYTGITLTHFPVVKSMEVESFPIMRNWGVLENWKSTASLGELL